MADEAPTIGCSSLGDSPSFGNGQRNQKAAESKIASVDGSLATGRSDAV
jgi:hypothetical protein